MGYTDIILTQPPKGGGYIDLKNRIGHRLVFLGTHSIDNEPDTMSKVPGATREVATVDYVDLDDGEGGVIKWGARVDKVGIVNKLRGQRNAIMGRLTLGEAKAGQSAPFILADHEPADAEYFFGTWVPANKAALAGAEQQKPSPATPPAAQPVQAVQAVQPPQPAQPAPVAAASPWAAQAPAAPAQLPIPAAVAAGAPEAYSPEAIAAVQRMIAAGQLPPMPTH